MTAVLLGAAIAAAGCARNRSCADLVRRGPLAALPDDTVGLLVVEVRALRALRSDIRWMEEIESIAREGGPLQEVAERFGLESFSGLERVGLAVVPAEGQRVEYGVIVEGEFDEPRMRAAMEGHEVLTIHEEAGRPDFSLTVLQGGHLAAGPRRVLDRVRQAFGKTGAGLDGNETLMERLRGVRAGAQLWGAFDTGRLAGLTRDFAAGRGFDAGALASTSRFSTLVSFGFQGRLGKTVELDLFGKARDVDQARSLADAARGLLALTRMAAGDKAPRALVELMDGTRVDQEKESIHVSATVSEKSLAVLAAQVLEDAARPAVRVPAGPGPAAPVPAPTGPPSGPVAAPAN